MDVNGRPIGFSYRPTAVSRAFSQPVVTRVVAAEIGFVRELVGGKIRNGRQIGMDEELTAIIV